ncbi:MAG: TetR family transcriptional regulator [Microbacterium arborescens]
MAWDTEATRRRLLDAAMEHFAAGGYAGARVEAIARTAGINKERIYSYFGDKAGLFGAVLTTEVDRLLDGIDIRGTGPDALGELAADLYDRAAAHPQLARLLSWESLELDEPVSGASRAEGCAAMVDALDAALPGRSRDEAAQLLVSTIAIATADGCLPHLTALITGGASARARRSAVIAQARALA